KQKHTARESRLAGVEARDERDPEPDLRRRGAPRQQRHHCIGRPWIEPRGVFREAGEVAPRYVARARRTPEPEPVAHGGEERRSERQPQKNRCEKPDRTHGSAI